MGPAYCYRPSSMVCPSVSRSAGLSVGLSVTVVSSGKTAEPSEMLFGLWTPVGLRKHVLCRSSDWHNAANAIEPPMCGGDAAFLSNYFRDLLKFHFVVVLQFSFV